MLITSNIKTIEKNILLVGLKLLIGNLFPKDMRD